VFKELVLTLACLNPSIAGLSGFWSSVVRYWEAYDDPETAGIRHQRDSIADLVANRHWFQRNS
jgi:hypothetical protein